MKLTPHTSAELARLQALSDLVATMLGTIPAVRSDERAALLQRCTTTADGVARELSVLELQEARS